MTRAAHPGSKLLRMGCAVLFLCLGIAATPAVAAEKPQRVASIYLCSDQLLLRLADRDRIVSLNRFSANPSLSNEVEATRGIPLNRGRAEEILPLEPDLVLAGTFTAPATKALLRRLGIPVVELEVEGDFDDIRTNIRRVAKALSEEARGEDLIADFESRLGSVAPASADRPSLLLYRFGGYSQGADTLSDAIFARAGFDNYAAERLDGVGRLSLEGILADPPDAILFSETTTGGNSLAAATLAHPVLRKLRREVPNIALPDRLWICGLSDSADAVKLLTDFRESAFGTPPRPIREPAG